MVCESWGIALWKREQKDEYKLQCDPLEQKQHQQHQQHHHNNIIIIIIIRGAWASSGE